MSDTNSLPKVSVVIPYYQRDTGILSRAVRSILAQRYPGDINIIVVDDGSPLPAQQELAWFATEHCEHPRHLEIVCQSNGGPAIARNTGLSRINDSVDFLAFLDSDDTWHTNHLERAVTTLSEGYDFYFSDYLPINSQRSVFQRDGFIPGEHGSLLHEDCFRFEGDFFDQTIRNNVVGTPTVVLRMSMLNSQRFNPDFQYAGEDHLFWLGVSQKTDRIVVSNQCEVACHQGVNIYESAKTLANPKTFQRVANELRFRKALPKLFKLNATQLARNDEIIETLRTEFAVNSIHALKTTPALGLTETLAFIRKDGGSLRAIGIEIAKVLRRRTSRHHNGY